MLWVATCEVRAKSVAGTANSGGRESRFLDEQAAVLELDVRELEAAIGGQPSATSREEAAEPSEA
jgi:hypothetical protein